MSRHTRLKTLSIKVPASLSALGPTLYGAGTEARYDDWRSQAGR
jgi:hypothetical protein